MNLSFTQKIDCKRKLNSSMDLISHFGLFDVLTRQEIPENYQKYLDNVAGTVDYTPDDLIASLLNEPEISSEPLDPNLINFDFSPDETVIIC